MPGSAVAVSDLRNLWDFTLQSFKTSFKLGSSRDSLFKTRLLGIKIVGLKEGALNKDFVELAPQDGTKPIDIDAVYRDISIFLNPKSGHKFNFFSGASTPDCFMFVFQDNVKNTPFNKVFYSVHIISPMMAIIGTVSLDLFSGKVNIEIPPMAVDLLKFKGESTKQ